MEKHYRFKKEGFLGQKIFWPFPYHIFLKFAIPIIYLLFTKHILKLCKSAHKLLTSHQNSLALEKS